MKETSSAVHFLDGCSYLQRKKLGTRSKGCCKYRFVLGIPEYVSMNIFPSSLFLIFSCFLIMGISFIEK